MIIGQAKAKSYWFALCLTDVFYYLCIAFPKKVEDFFILGVIDFWKACI